MNGKMSHCLGCNAEMESDAIFCSDCGLAQIAAISERIEPKPLEIPTATPESFKLCPKCGKQVLKSVKFCSACAHEFSIVFESVVPSPIIPPSPTAFHKSTFSTQLVAAVKQRYKDGYLQARAITGIGAVVKGLGMVIGIVMSLAGFVIGGGIAEQSRNSMFGGPGAGAGVVVGFIFVLIGAIIAIILWVIGVIVKSSGQMLKAQLDGAVNSSPFLTDLDRAEMMSLPIGAAEKKTSEVSSSNAREYIGGSSDSGMLPNVRASLSYGASFIIGVLWVPVPIYILATTPVSERFVRFHAFQSIFLTIALFVVGYAIQVLFGVSVNAIGGMGASGIVILWLLISSGSILLCLWKAYNDEEFKIPVLGDFAMDFATKAAKRGTTF